jgi:hypothetical protein
MEKSTSIINLSKAMILFHVKVDKIKKDAKNPFFKSSYASLSNILDAINLPLNEAGLTFLQFPSGENGLTTILIHGESGEYMQDTYEMKPVKDDPQGRGSVITYQRRYALAAVLGLNIDDDDDANTATHGGKTPETAEDMRPWMTEQHLIALLKRIAAGEKDAYDKADKAFRMKKEYRSQLKQQLNGQ